MIQNNSNNHLDKIQKSGLKLISENETIVVHPDMATQNILEIPQPDLVLMCVKSYDLAAAVQDVNRVMTAETIILPLLNGINIPERIRINTDKGAVLPACVYVGTHVAEPGVIEQKGGNGRIIFGDDQINGTKAAVQTAAVLKELGISGDYLPNPDVAIWTKYLFIAAYGIVTAATGKTLGAVYENNQLKRNVKEIMIEIVKLAS
jgi:2-dehydropantoate 2-reductase